MGSVSNIIFATMTSGYEGYGSRVHDLETARSMFDAFAAAGYRDVDTADGYGNGSCEQMLGDLGVAKDFSVATRFTPLSTPHGHEPVALETSCYRTWPKSACGFTSTTRSREGRSPRL